MSLLEKRFPNVVIHGEVTDAAEFISRNSVMIVPLFSGSGMRVKIVEGMVMGKVIISTSLGKEGIDASDKQHLLVSNTADQFIDAIQYCVDHPDEAALIGQNAMEKVAQQFEKKEAAKQIMDIYQSLLVYEKNKLKPLQ